MNGLPLVHALCLMPVAANASSPPGASIPNTVQRHPLLLQLEERINALTPLHQSYAALRKKRVTLSESEAALADGCHALFMGNGEGSATGLHNLFASAQKPVPNLLAHMDSYSHKFGSYEESAGWFQRMSYDDFLVMMRNNHNRVVGLDDEEVAAWEQRFIEFDATLGRARACLVCRGWEISSGRERGQKTSFSLLQGCCPRWTRRLVRKDCLEMDLMLEFDADVWREGCNATIQAKETNWALRSLRAHVFAACIDGIRDAVGSWLRSLAAQELIEVVEVEREAVVPRNHALRPETLRYLAHEDRYLRAGGEDWVSEDEDKLGKIKGQDDNRDSCAERAANRTGRMASDVRSSSEKRNIWR
ncbi:hypothetical protein BDZ90DRAFT_225754 [Jaminaea rosea]|uniref:Uncharacterized protein n=1 Tax=Jaminaea rosea TaxID=1569628 RepID=A0A316UVP4_9BASI|nr:hypothetical protein BDZ90DRAFT_225754 [Jaminaea rosea]PWN29349.1 hypothetical protein BDZ90DRAFT_225754 [Jaminaea rosea]